MAGSRARTGPARPGRRLTGIPTTRGPSARLRLALTLLATALVVGYLGYLLLGLGWLDSAYMTVITVTTVGYREIGVADEPSAAYRAFTMLLALGGVGTALYTLGVLLETLVEGRLTDRLGRRRMQREIDALAGHVIVCGYGRVGKVIAEHVGGLGGEVVVVERDGDPVRVDRRRLVEGDATDDAVLRAAGIERAHTLVAALDTDAENLYVTLTARSLAPELFIVARARVDSAEPKLLQAGADRVVNPHRIGGARMAALAVQPHVAEFLDVVMHDGSLEFRLSEILVAEGSALDGRTMREAHIRDRTGALVLAARAADGAFTTNPTPDSVLRAGHVLIAIGTGTQLAALGEAAGSPTPAGR